MWIGGSRCTLLTFGYICTQGVFHFISNFVSCSFCFFFFLLSTPLSLRSRVKSTYTRARARLGGTVNPLNNVKPDRTNRRGKTAARAKNRRGDGGTGEWDRARSACAAAKSDGQMLRVTRFSGRHTRAHATARTSWIIHDRRPVSIKLLARWKRKISRTGDVLFAIDIPPPRALWKGGGRGEGTAPWTSGSQPGVRDYLKGHVKQKKKWLVTKNT